MNRPLLTCILASCLFLANDALADGPFDHFDLPDAWEAKFWAEPNAVAIRKLDPKAVADLVPVQAGFRHCRCPKCGASEAEDALTWSFEKPDLLTCRKCGKSVPDAEVPAKVDNKIPEEVIEVLPHRFHHYPYHAVETEKQLYPEERIFLRAKRDYLVREFLAKFALYAAVKHRETNDPALAKLSCAILLRFAQVYPSYATHYDQPGRPKFLDRADLPPPYRRDYATGKWDWAGCLDIPLDLVVACALMRDDPAMAEIGQILGDTHPRRTIEKDLFFAAAEFVGRQPFEDSVSTLYAIRGTLAVGRLLGDPLLVHDGTRRLEAFLARGFYHDGVWRQGDGLAQRQVLGQIDGWIDRLLAGYSDPVGYRPPDGSPRLDRLPGAGFLPTLALARSAQDVKVSRSNAGEIALASWPAPAASIVSRRPTLLGGAGVVRLGVGSGDDALDLDLRGMGDYGSIPSGRLAMRLSVGGRSILGDLDDSASNTWGFERASASRNTVVVDGLNQRENLGDLRDPAAGSDILFYAADRDFQVAMMADRFAYPHSASIYRETLFAASIGKTRYGVSIFEIRGGLQHDQIFHASAGSGAKWKLSIPSVRGPDTLLPATIPFLPGARPEDGRWFVQAMGAFTDLSQARVEQPIQAVLSSGEPPGVRLHLLPDEVMSVMTATSPDPSADVRGALILRRRSEDGSNLETVFVTVFEPIGISPPLKRVGRVNSPADVIMLAVEAAEGVEFLVMNRKPSMTVEARLPDGRIVRTDGLLVRIGSGGVTLAGGTFAEVGDHRVNQTRASGKIVGAQSLRKGDSLGAFATEDPIREPETLVGRALLIKHGDGTTRGWTIASVVNSREKGATIQVRERVGFRIDASTGAAVYDQFPGLSAPGPHSFGISKIAR